MDSPPTIPADAQARIELARAQAEREFATRRKESEKDPAAVPFTSVLLDYIHHVFFASARAICEAGLHENWSLHTIRKMVEEERDRIIDEVLDTKHPNRGAHSAHGKQLFRRKAIKHLENSDEWPQYLESLENALQHRRRERAQLAGIHHVTEKMKLLPAAPPPSSVPLFFSQLFLADSATSTDVGATPGAAVEPSTSPAPGPAPARDLAVEGGKAEGDMAHQRDAHSTGPLEEVSRFLEEWERLSTEAARLADEEKLTRELLDEFKATWPDLVDMFDRTQAADPAERLMAMLDPDYETKERKTLGEFLVSQHAQELQDEKEKHVHRARIRARVWAVLLSDARAQGICRIISDLNPSDGNAFGHLGGLFRDLVRLASEAGSKQVPSELPKIPAVRDGGADQPAPAEPGPPVPDAVPPANWEGRKVLRPDEVAAILRVTRRYVYTLVKDRQLERASTGGSRAIRIITSSVLRFLETKKRVNQ